MDKTPGEILHDMKTEERHRLAEQKNREPNLMDDAAEFVSRVGRGAKKVYKGADALAADILQYPAKAYGSSETVKFARDPLGESAKMYDVAKGAAAGDYESQRTALDAAGMLPVVGEVADATSMGLDLKEGDYVGAGISGAALLLPFVSAGWLKRAINPATDSLPMPPDAAEKIKDLNKRVESGEVTDDTQIRRELAQIEDDHAADYYGGSPSEEMSRIQADNFVEPPELETARLFREKGYDSPYFQQWSGGRKPGSIPSSNLIPQRVRRDGRVVERSLGDWRRPAEGPINEKYADAHELLMKQAPDPSKVTYIDQVAYTPDLIHVHHSTRPEGFSSRQIDYDIGNEFGLHSGTFQAAQERKFLVENPERQYAVGDYEKTTEGLSPLPDAKMLPPPLGLDTGKIKRSYDQERVFAKKYNKLLPLQDLAGWSPQAIAVQTIKEADRLGEKGLSRDMREYLEKVIKRQSDAGIDLHDSSGRSNLQLDPQDIRDIYIKNGFDGVVYENMMEGRGELSFISIKDGTLKLVAEAPDALGKPTGKFDPSTLYTAGLSIPIAKALGQQKEPQED